MIEELNGDLRLVGKELDWNTWLLIIFLCGKEGPDVVLSVGLDCAFGLVVDELDWDI